jgi:hypothetical protein
VPVSDTKPVEPTPPAPAGKGLWKIFSILSLGALVIAIVAAVLTVMYIGSTKDTEIVKLRNDVISLEAQIAELIGFDETDPDQKFIEFPTIGVRVPVSDELAGKISVEAVEIEGIEAAYTVNYNSCQGALGIVYSSSITASMNLTGAVGAPKIIYGDTYVAFIAPTTLTCDSSELGDLGAFNTDNVAWLEALDSAEAFTPLVDEENV